MGVGFVDISADETAPTPVWVSAVLPGEQVEAVVTAKAGNIWQARAEKILKASPQRREPRCAVFGHCGGCQLQHMSYDAQLEFKVVGLKSALRDFSFDLRPIIPSPQEYEYRNRVTIHHNRKRWGFHAAQSNEIVSTENCAIASTAVNAFLNDDLLKYASPVEVRENGVAAKPFFAQVNSVQNTNLIQVVCSLLPKSKRQRILELYAGGGNLSFDLARHASEVVAVEGNEQAVEFMRERIRSESKKAAILPRCQDVADAVYELVNDCEQFDVIVCDPPRDGLLKAVNQIDKLGARTLIYVSCHPTAFARDAKQLNNKNYVLQSVTPIDMFPQTRHLEIVGVFSYAP